MTTSLKTSHRQAIFVNLSAGVQLRPPNKSFEKVSALRAIAPTQKEPPFAITQIAVLIAFVTLTVLAVKKFRSESMTAIKATPKAV